MYYLVDNDRQDTCDLHNISLKDEIKSLTSKLTTCFPWIYEQRSIKFKLVHRCHQLLVNDQSPRVSRQLTNDKGENRMIPGTVHRSSGIYLAAEDNSGKPQLGDRR
jgi:hypothetical protein